MQELSGKVAVVTGGASDIGAGLARAFAREGMKLVIADIEDEPREKAVAELQGRGAEVVGVKCDVAVAESVASTAERALDAYGAVHVVCNNAGVASGGSGKPSWDQPIEDWEWTVGVNLWGVIYGVRSFMPILLQQEEAHFVNTASMAGLIHGSGVYGITKHAVVALSEGLFSELRQSDANVGVSVLCPGYVNTRILESERNRPERPRETAELTPEMRAARDGFAQLLKSGRDPRAVGDMVTDAIRNRRFYIYTDPWHELVRERMENVVGERDPVHTPRGTQRARG